MVYTTNIPQPTDNPSSVSRQQFLDNFNDISTALAINHVGFNDADQGKHNFAQMPEQGAAPTTAVNEGAIYTKEVSSASQLFYREENSGDERQITSAFVAANPGSFTLPGGLIAKWATATMSGTSILINTGFSSLYTVQISPRGDTTNNFAWATSAANFNILTDNANTTQISWLAIGM